MLRLLCLHLVLTLPKQGLEEAAESLQAIIDFHHEEVSAGRFGVPRYAGTRTAVIENVQLRPDLILEDD